MMMSKPTRLGGLQSQVPSGRGTLLTPWTTLSASQMLVALHSALTTKPGGRRESQPALAGRILSLLTHSQERPPFNRIMLIQKSPMLVPRDNAERAKANSRTPPWKQSMPLFCRSLSLPTRYGHLEALLQTLDLQIQGTLTMCPTKLLCRMKWTWIELGRSIGGIVQQHVHSL